MKGWVWFLVVIGAGILLGRMAANGSFEERGKVLKKNKELYTRTSNEEDHLSRLKKSVNNGRRNRDSDIAEFARATEETRKKEPVDPDANSD